MSGFFLIGRIIQVIDVGLAVSLFALMYVTAPPKQTLRRYPMSVKIRLLFPSKGWRNVVRSEDIEALRRLRKGLFACEALFLGWNTIAILYFGVLSSRLVLMVVHGQCG
jgi:hypothetical protein